MENKLLILLLSSITVFWICVVGSIALNNKINNEIDYQYFHLPLVLVPLFIAGSMSGLIFYYTKNNKKSCKKE